MYKTKLFTRSFGPLQYGLIQRPIVSVMNIENIDMKKEALAVFDTRSSLYLRK